MVSNCDFGLELHVLGQYDYFYHDFTIKPSLLNLHIISDGVPTTGYRWRIP
ncbi:hypothetical protein [Nostoc parmelioides]|uniref:hypothetical protein n=1 Tax=Nostoc parmelioides TaxID=1521621 RepID=UPI001684D460|nr:hypothetical protein [Nostoc parmelioides]